LLIDETPQAFVTVVLILDAVDDMTLESSCADSPENLPQRDIHVVCVDDLDMTMEDSEQIDANFQTVAYVSAMANVCTQQNRLANDQVHATEGGTCGSTANERKKIRQEQERRMQKQARLEARNTLRRKKREELKNKAVKAANANTLTGACETTEATAKTQKRKKPAVLATSKHENTLPSIEISQKKSKTTHKSPADSVEQNAAHGNTLSFPAETAHSANWLSSIKQKLSTTADSSILLRNDPIFAMFANF